MRQLGRFDAWLVRLHDTAPQEFNSFAALVAVIVAGLALILCS